jgi:TolA-binding protein
MRIYEVEHTYWVNQVKYVQQMLKGVVSSFLLCSINYPHMFRLPNAIFRGYIVLS